MIMGMVYAFLAQTTTQPASGPTSKPTAQALEDARQLLQVLDLNETIRRTPWSGWVILLAGLLIGSIGGKIVQSVLKLVGKRLADRGWGVRATAVLALAGPANLAIFATGLLVGLAPVALADQLRNFEFKILQLLYIIAVAWFCWGLIELIELGLRKLISTTGSELDNQIVPLIRKTLRLFLLIVFVLFTASSVFNANITAWLAGFGVAGLAVSLAAQDSIKNFFGSLTIFLDRPFAVGERVRLDRYEGTIEEIGYRSTRLRTDEGHLITIPNSKIVDNYVENLSRQQRTRRELTVKVPANKVEQAATVIRQVLGQQPIASDLEDGEFAPHISFDEFAAGAISIHVAYWFKSSQSQTFSEHEQKVNLALLRALHEAGIQES